ncbi:MAG: fumarylacetoacetate hydrolase family protein [Oscillospiraceae bacterium]|jgi:2-keto-4-pentenoate hydratase/2-oxohepta-3-ene-1,7-dioic acid hydratase in catechol pathway|nr:fumarylacetoacetate hydrolase family protein [Oscillospiraceae bacterium]
MKLCTFLSGGATRVGVKTPRGVVDITAIGFPGDMNAVIASARIADIAAAVERFSGEYIDEAEISFANITSPAKIVCEGLNYRDHAEETHAEIPEHPVFFSKFNDALHPAGQPVTLPTWQRCFDYEAELVIVVGRQAYNIPREGAEEYIFGYACGNDLSARDAQLLSSQWLSGKSFPGFAPVGPYITTRDEFNPDAGADIICEVNGARVQSGNTKNMIFSCGEALFRAARFFPLSPGDLIFTGTPAGVILGKPKGSRVWLVAGDTVTVTIAGLGSLTTPLI